MLPFPSTFVRASRDGIVLPAIAAVPVLDLLSTKPEAALIGHLEQISPTPQVYVQDVDFRTFGPDENAVHSRGGVLHRGTKR